MTRYGSIIGSPPRRDPPTNESRRSDRAGGPPSLHLPDPALHGTNTQGSEVGDLGPPAIRQELNQSEQHNAFAGGHSRSPHTARSAISARHLSLFPPKRTISMPEGPSSRPFIRRVMSLGGRHTPPTPQHNEVEMTAYRELDLRQAEFFDFLDQELLKIDEFYKQKETEATERLKIMREQLHIMRDRRLEDLIAARRSIASLNPLPRTLDGVDDEDIDPLNDKSLNPFKKPWKKALAEAANVAHGGRVGKATKAMEGLATPSKINVGVDANRDYTRKRSRATIPYRSAKRKLKIAMQEYYRGLELLKSYALLNRTGFRKINKKYDKTVNARPAYRYMAEKVNKTWFVQSDVVDEHIRTVEDLYARYFEQGNHKIAATKLRRKSQKAGDYTGSVFRTGLWVSAGAVFGVQGLVYGSELLFSSDVKLATDTSFLLQVRLSPCNSAAS